jgi:hypothetical protein
LPYRQAHSRSPAYGAQGGRASRSNTSRSP